MYEITNTLASGQAVLNRYGPVISNIAYAAQGPSYQAGGLPLWNPNADHDTYMEDAFFENDMLQFCQHTKVNGKAAICVGRITGIPNNLTCNAKTISDPNLYLSFPSMAYAGSSATDNSVILGIDHAGVNTFPGLSAVYVNSDFDISPLAPVKTGVDTINGLWGDFSGMCRRYNHPGEVWFEGQYGSNVFPRINWIAKLERPANCEGESANNTGEGEEFDPGLSIYPNPLSTSTSISFTLPEAKDVSVKIYDANGKLVQLLTDGKLEEGEYKFYWNTEEISSGTYYVQFVSNDFAVSKEISVIK